MTPWAHGSDSQSRRGRSGFSMTEKTSLPSARASNRRQLPTMSRIPTVPASTNQWQSAFTTMEHLPASGMHCGQQKVRVEPARADDL